MQLVVSPAVLQKYPRLKIARIDANGLANRGECAPLVEACEREAARARTRFPSVEALGEHRTIACWRDVYRSFGAKPNRTRPSAESLLRRIVKGEGVPWINKAVNAYLLTQVAMAVPVGGYDVEHVEGALQLAIAEGGENFIPIGGEPEPVAPGEVVYRDAAGVLTRRWNFRDCDRTKISEDSTEIALFVEAPTPQISAELLDEAARAIAEALKAHCGGQTRVAIHDAVDLQS